MDDLPGIYFYILDKGNIRKAASIAEYSEFARDFDKRRVDRTLLDIKGVKVEVSTVFLMIDHGHSHVPGSPAILFETMVFGGEWDQFQERYSTFGSAKIGHWKIVDAIRSGKEVGEVDG